MIVCSSKDTVVKNQKIKHNPGGKNSANHISDKEGYCLFVWFGFCSVFETVQAGLKLKILDQMW
jgi:hypothetical protein